MCIVCVQQQEIVNTRLLSIYTAKLLLKDTSCMEFCLHLLQSLLKSQGSLLSADVRTGEHTHRHNAQVNEHEGDGDMHVSVAPLQCIKPSISGRW